MPIRLRPILEGLITIQTVLPFRLPPEIWAWYKYEQTYSKTCDSCNEDRGDYIVSYRDPTIPSTVIVPFPLRLCTTCLCDADTAVGVFEDGDTGDEETFSINRV